MLETLNKHGIATRSEITDAAYAGQSECVLINKGDYIINVIKTLTDILHRSERHHAKKRYTFRPMKIAADFFVTNGMSKQEIMGKEVPAEATSFYLEQKETIG